MFKQNDTHYIKISARDGDLYIQLHHNPHHQEDPAQAR